MSQYNIYLAMGLEPEDAAVQAVRADLAAAITRHLERRGIRQARAATLLGLSQAAVSNLKRGKVDHLSIERLLRAMVRAGIPGYANWPDADRAVGGVMPVAQSAASVTADASLSVDLSAAAYLPLSDHLEIERV
jgi:predicted XRE-type DNA-binding protein